MKNIYTNLIFLVILVVLCGGASIFFSKWERNIPDHHPQAISSKPLPTTPISNAVYPVKPFDAIAHEPILKDGEEAFNCTNDGNGETMFIILSDIGPGEVHTVPEGKYRIISQDTLNGQKGDVMIDGDEYVFTPDQVGKLMMNGDPITPGGDNYKVAVGNTHLSCLHVKS